MEEPQRHPLPVDAGGSYGLHRLRDVLRGTPVAGRLVKPAVHSVTPTAPSDATYEP